MDEHFQGNPVELPSDRRQSDVEMADLWLRIPDLRSGAPTKAPSAGLPVGLVDSVKRLLLNQWQRHASPRWRKPSSVFLGSFAMIVVAVGVMIVMPSSDKKPSGSDFVSTPGWSPSVATSPPSGQDQSTGQADRLTVANHVTPWPQPPTEPAATSPWPRRPASPEQLMHGDEAANVHTPTYNQYRPQMAADYPGIEAPAPPVVAEFEGMIERPPYRAQYDDHRSSLH